MVLRSLLAWLALGLAAYVAAVGATTFAAALAVGPVVPALLAAVAAVWLFARDNRYDFVVAAGLGLLADLTAPAACGLAMCSFLLAGFLVTSLRRGWFLGILPGRLAATFVWVWWTAQVEALGWLAIVSGEGAAAHLLWQPAAVALYTTLLTMPVWFVLGWIAESARIATPEQSWRKLPASARVPEQSLRKLPASATAELAPPQAS